MQPTSTADVASTPRKVLGSEADIKAVRLDVCSALNIGSQCAMN